MSTSVSMRVTAAFTCAGAFVAAAITRDLGPRLVLDGTPLAPLCHAIAALAAVAALLPDRARLAREVVDVLLGAVRLTIPLVLCLAWTGEGRELWAALAVWVGVHDGDAQLSPRAPLAPAALAITAVMLYGASEPMVAPGHAALIGMIAGSAAAWASERRRSPRP